MNSTRPRHSGNPLGCAVLWLAGCTVALASASPPADDPEERLRQVREALVENALAGPTTIRSAAWIDESGVLHENTRFRSDVTIRGIRMPTYLPEPPAPAEPAVEDTEEELIVTDLVAGVGADVSVLGDAGLFDAPICGSTLELISSAELHTSVRAHRSHAQYAHLQDIGSAVSDVLVRSLNHDPAWRVRMASSRTPDNAYFAALEGSVADSRPLRLVLEILPSDQASRRPLTREAAAAQSLENTRHELGRFHDRVVRDRWPRQVRREFVTVIRIALYEHGQRTAMWSDESEFVWEDRQYGMQASAMTPEHFAGLTHVAKRWTEALSTLRDCDIPRFPVLAQTRRAADTSPEEYILGVGADVGLAVGDRLVLADALRIPARVLENGIAEEMALGEVVEVDSFRATVRRVAGPRPAFSPQLVALPL